MGWTVLYIAFGAVALWLLGEVLLQYKARLRWRLLAFFGFLTVVVGVVVLSSVLVIGVGAVAFATGQTLVTLSYRKGFVAGWALDGLPGLPDLPGLSRQRDEEEHEEYEGAEDRAGEADQPQEVSGRQEYAYGRPEDEFTAYAPQPLPEESGEYGVYRREDDVFAGGDAFQDPQGYPQYQSAFQDQQDGYGQYQDAYAAYSDPYVDYRTPEQQPAAAGYDAGYADGSYAGYGQDAAVHGGWDPYAAAGHPGQGFAQQTGYYYDEQPAWPAQGYDQSAGYDQQAGYYPQAAPAQAGYDDGGAYSGGYTGYDAGYAAGYVPGQDSYTAQQGYDPAAQYQGTPAEGVWVPQPREGEALYQAPGVHEHQPSQDAYGYDTDRRGGY